MSAEGFNLRRVHYTSRSMYLARARAPSRTLYSHLYQNINDSSLLTVENEPVNAQDLVLCTLIAALCLPVQKAYADAILCGLLGIEWYGRVHFRIVSSTLSRFNIEA